MPAHAQITTGRPLPTWVFSLAKIGDTLGHGGEQARLTTVGGAQGGTGQRLGVGVPESRLSQ